MTVLYNMLQTTAFQSHLHNPVASVCVCVFVGLLRRKGGKWEREENSQKHNWIRGGRLLSTSLHAAAQRSKVHVFLDGLGYLLLLQYL